MNAALARLISQNSKSSHANAAVNRAATEIGSLAIGATDRLVASALKENTVGQENVIHQTTTSTNWTPQQLVEFEDEVAQAFLDKRIRAPIQNEAWLPVVGYEGLYDISNHGRVRTMKARHPSMIGAILKIAPGRYARVCLTKCGEHKKFFVHRLVAAAFIGPVPENCQVNHKDGDKKNNHASNLEYMDAWENMGAFRRGKGKKYNKLRGVPIKCQETFEAETWRDVIGYEGHYKISNLGRIVSVFGYHRTKANRLMQPRLTRTGRKRIGLSKNGITKPFFVARLVAAAFIGVRPNGWVVNHIDADKTNDNVENLEYTTPSGNSKHAFDLGLMPGAFKAGHAYHRRRE